MDLLFQVKTRLIFAAALCLGGLSRAEDAPDARAILQTVRTAQTAQDLTVRGKLRTEGKSIPFRLVADGGVVRWEFTDPPQALQLRFLDKDTRLEEITGGTTKKVGPAKFDDKVRGSDISYEDLAMKFIYWPNATVEGTGVIMVTQCWEVLCEPAAKSDSQYSKVRVWIAKETGALMKAEAFGHNGKLARTFTVRSGQKIDGVWLLKQMRIESFDAGRSADRAPTYLEVDGVEKQ